MTGFAPPILYHYTCADHGHPGIAHDGYVKPNPHPFLRASLVWLTDLAVPDRHGLGLTAGWIRCDRSAIRVDVRTTSEVVRWGEWAHTVKPAPVIRELLEDGAFPAHWWVSPVPLSVIRIQAPHRTVMS